MTGQGCQTRSLDCLSRDVYLASSRAASISMLMTGGFAVWIDYHCIVDHAKVVSMDAEIPSPSMYPLYPFRQCKREPAVRLDCRPVFRIASIQSIASSPVSADKQAHGNVVDHRCLSGGTDCRILRETELAWHLWLCAIMYSHRILRLRPGGTGERAVG